MNPTEIFLALMMLMVIITITMSYHYISKRNIPQQTAAKEHQPVTEVFERGARILESYAELEKTEQYQPLIEALLEVAEKIMPELCTMEDTLNEALTKATHEAATANDIAKARYLQNLLLISEDTQRVINRYRTFARLMKSALQDLAYTLPSRISLLSGLQERKEDAARAKVAFDRIFHRPTSPFRATNALEPPQA